MTRERRVLDAAVNTTVCQATVESCDLCLNVNRRSLLVSEKSEKVWTDRQLTNRTHAVSSKIIAQQYFESASSFVFGRFLAYRTYSCICGPSFSQLHSWCNFFRRCIFTSRFLAMPCPQWPIQDVQNDPSLGRCGKYLQSFSDTTTNDQKLTNEKSAKRDANTARWLQYKTEPKIFAQPQTPSRGRGTAKI